ncbi:hypothetical protein K432DRAFT_293892 [Lepidopterella palustris CBS 459.81]|uniref:C2H2-type domain-containing protein n=1 Tax=Lepidopterella palustris CBS 459.81 TaxID=1314670 RepID=A0A8E2JGU7_9PEZI|nr:hypothetical protein K432DRAFT_293892 [Lepidopterella palustris CBS 459.81]
MVSYAEYPPAMPHDFELYSNQEHHPHFDLLATSQPYLPTSTYLDPTFSAPFDPLSLQAFSQVSRSQSDLRYHFDGIAQGVKPNCQHQHYSPEGSPNSASHSFDVQPPNLSTSSESGASVSSSAMGSPSLNPQYHHDPWNSMTGLGLAPGIVQSSSGFDYDSIVATDKLPGCVDPTLIQPFPTPIPFAQSPYPEIRTTPSPRFPFVEQPPSPAPSNASAYSQNRAGSRQFKRGSQSPYLHTQAFAPYPNFPTSRRQSDVSIHSHHSQASRKSGNSYDLDDESREKGLCPIPECGRVFKDLKAHMLTHQNERPEKCPIATCEYHLKGFARKYDKNRHTLTHYKGTMVCGFCPGSGSAAEKSFNRADVFKRHLTSVHGVEQAPPNSRKKSPTGKKAYSAAQSNLAGTCSTCSVTFANAQEFYEHLDDCVLRVVQQADPSEAINQKLLSSVADDKDVAETMDRNGLPNAIDYVVPNYDEEDEDEDDLDIDNDDQNDDTYGGLPISGSGRKKRKNYPVSWGCATDKMKMKKRVLCVYDGQRRLLKDDMMLDQEFEVRMTLPDGKNYVTDLDVQTLKRAEAIHGATAEERGPWVPDNILDTAEGDDQFLA